jgi:DNA-binding transcriptional ArsR family regulator
MASKSPHPRQSGSLVEIMSAVNPATDQDSVCATYLKALGEPIRLRIVKALQAGPMTVSDLSELLESDLSNVSHHLRVLFHAQLVTTRREGKFNYYHLNVAFLSDRALPKTLDFGCCKLDLRG